MPDKLSFTIYQIDAFARNVFEGNPAAVIPLDEWLDDALMQRIAMENNLSETAFFIPEGKKWQIRWFTPTAEVDMCGHATLASAYVLFECLDYPKEEVVFASRSGDLHVRREDEWYVMDFPVQPIEPCELPCEIAEAFVAVPVECYCSMDYLLVFENESDIIYAEPVLEKLRNIDARGVIITAKSSRYDFVCRFFAPKYGIDEDPVTGSAFTQLIPYWNRTTGKEHFSAKQISKRGGEVLCTLQGERVEIAGYAVKFLEGKIVI
ncbi:MAG: PhzF family phenazine biosynthesis protein [Sulfuricurvum sp.]